MPGTPAARTGAQRAFATASSKAKDYYDLLGVPRGASADEIKKAYRAIAKKCHPDVNGGDEAATQRFRDAQKAYDVLRDDNKRRLYDNFGESAAEGDHGAGGGFPGGGGGFPGGFPGGMGGFGGFPGGFEFHSMGGQGQMDPELEEILEQFFGGGGATRGRRRGAHVSANLSVSFKESVSGTKHSLVVDGSGNGSERVNLEVPAGVEDGDTLVVEGLGGYPRPGRDGRTHPDAKRGDLHIKLSVPDRDPTGVFERSGADLRVVARLTYAQACLGTIFDVPVVPGSDKEAVRVRIPAGVSHNEALRVENGGLPVLRRRGPVVVGSAPGGRRGDLYVRIAIDIPKTVSAERRKLLEQLRALEEAEER